MKHGIYLIAALLAGALLISVLRIDAGYVGISFLGVLIEMSVTTLILVMLASYFALWLGLRTIRMRRRRRQEQIEYRRERARTDLARGLLEFAAGDWTTCERTVIRSARDGAHPIVNYLIAARAADMQGAHERRAGWFKMAREADPREATPVLVSQAEIQLKHKQFEAARASLQELEASGQLNSRGLLLLARLYAQLVDFEKLRALEPKLRAARGIRAAAVNELMDQAYLEMLKAGAESGDPERLDKAWNHASKPATRRPEIVLAYARGAMKCGNHAGAEEILRAFLNQEWLRQESPAKEGAETKANEALVATYGELELPDPLEPLAVAEEWLHTCPENPALLIACARLSMRAELYGKARSYLETSLSVRRQPETYQLLGNLLEQLGEKERASQVLNEGLAFAIGRRANLPKIKLRRYQARPESLRRP